MYFQGYSSKDENEDALKIEFKDRIEELIDVE